MKVKYVGRRPREIAPAGRAAFRVSPGEVVDVPVGLARSLLDQKRFWEEVKPPVKVEKDGEV